jgi:vacuolar-type H+-ATPase subunit C/Vma6
MSYPYANGIIKAKENLIFDKSKFSKLIKTEKNDFLKTLVDLGYGNGVNFDGLEDLINHELEDTKKLLDEISPERKYTDLFFLANDALNIKFLYKRKIFGVNHLDIFVSTGTITKDDLHKAILESDLSSLSRDNAKLLNKVNDRVKDLSNPRLISANIDNCVFEYIFEKLKYTFNNTLKTYFQAFIDFANVITMIRCKRLNWNYDQFLEMFLDFGKISENDFKAAYLLQSDEVLGCFKEYYLEKVSKGLKIYLEKKDINFLERYFDSLIINLMKEYQNDAFEIGPIICYYLKKQAEANNIRIIYASNEIDLNDLIEY